MFTTFAIDDDHERRAQVADRRAASPARRRASSAHGSAERRDPQVARGGVRHLAVTAEQVDDRRRERRR